MRLSEDRVESIALAISDRLAEEELVDLEIDEDDLAILIGRVIVRDLTREDEIQREAVQWIEINKSHLETGTTAWQVEMDKRRESIAIQRGYVLP